MPAAYDSALKRRRMVWLVLLLVVVIGAAATGWHFYSSGARAASRSAEETRARQAELDPESTISVETVRLSKGGIMRTSTQIGSVHPFKEADLYAKVSGYLKVLNVDYGSRVKKDQVLAEIDDPEIVTEAQKAAADLELARAAVEQAKAFIETAKADRDAEASAVEKAKAEVERYVAMTSYHDKKYARYKQLVKSQAIPQQLADEEEENFESSRASELASNKKSSMPGLERSRPLLA